jgi:hypothetical protein
MFKTKNTALRRTHRTDAILRLRQTYEGNIHTNPKIYNKAYTNALHKLADALENITNP